MRRAAKRDISEPGIVDALRKVGASVYRLHVPVDLAIGFRGQTFFAECKTGKGKLNAAQARFIEEWRGSAVVIFRSPDDVVNWVNGLEK